MLRVTTICLAIAAIHFQHACAQSAARGRALCVGLNEVDPSHYGSPLRLAGCRNDAEDMATILRGIPGFDEPKRLLDSEATVAAAVAELQDAAKQLQAGDIFVLTIAAHGSQLPDLNGDEAELDSSDRLDETWLMYDRMWIDDERSGLWSEFKKDVRILIIADTCHSGTTIRNPFAGTGSAHEIMNGVLLGAEAGSARVAAQREIQDLVRGGAALQSDDAFYRALLAAKSRAEAFPVEAKDRGIRDRGLGRDVGAETRAIAEISQTVRTIDRRDALALYAARREVYDPILQREAANERSPVQASMILLAACQDHQTAADGSINGAFTGTLQEVWNEEFRGTYEEFLNEIKRRLFNRYFDQTPNYLPLGSPNPDFLYKAQQPFSVRL